MFLSSAFKTDTKSSTDFLLKSYSKNSQFSKVCNQTSTQEYLFDSDSTETSPSYFQDTSFDKSAIFSSESHDSLILSLKERNLCQNSNFSLNKFKTEKCKNFELFGECKFGSSCFFAHGKNELRSKTSFSDFYKTKLCRNYFKNGFCHYSSRCQYFHLKPSDAYQELYDSYLNKIYTKITDNETNVFANGSEVKGDNFKNRLGIFLTITNQANRNVLHSDPPKPSMKNQ